MQLLALIFVGLLLLSLPLWILYSYILKWTGKLPKPLDLRGIIPDNYEADPSDEESQYGDIMGCFTTTGELVGNFEVVRISDEGIWLEEVGTGRSETDVLMERGVLNDQTGKKESYVFRKRLSHIPPSKVEPNR